MEEKKQLIKNELSVFRKDDLPLITSICRALSVPERLSILSMLLKRSLTIAEIAKILDLPLTSTVFHVNALEKANIIYTERFTSSKGVSRICYLNCFNVVINFFELLPFNDESVSVSMPIGHYTECEPGDLCGIALADHCIDPANDRRIFFRPERVDAQLIWMNHGKVSYNFPNNYFDIGELIDLKFSFEICSEAPNYRTNYPSDITVSVNDTEVVTFTSPGDFGERHGKYTPAWWRETGTQYGLLKSVSVRKYGCLLDEKLVNPNVTLSDLRLTDRHYIKLSIAVKSDAQFVGGFNLFGRGFGDYPQDIVMEMFFKRA